ncbi:uncharacterized protein LOC125940130 isoform X1 [Dermacentor silvarum]|uniref:uncharacterized protein LOC125940130 isoform X1 n=1 Tax=Dermacentor silvarum TaxID=543639 RepID=UPI002101A81D|nr:uncharacterized protein LOC125940130 isoform X1 [Dermacentor silvarum]
MRGQRIGKGVSLYAHITYDSVYTNAYMTKLGNAHYNTIVEKHFDELFEKVQNYLKKHSIFIKIIISSVRKYPLSVKHGSVVDARRTLRSVENYGKSLHKSNNTVFYHFTGSTRLFHSRPSHIRFTVGQGDFETNGTFCTEHISATVIRRFPKSEVYWVTVKSTAMICGSEHFVSFTPKDINKMKQAFSQCPKPETEKPHVITTEASSLPGC